MNEQTLIPISTTCPPWCVVDHDAEYRQERDAWAEHGHSHPGPDPDPLHRGVDVALGRPGSDSEREWGFVRLLQDGGAVRVAIGDEFEVTPDVAEQLASLLPGLVEQARMV